LDMKEERKLKQMLMYKKVNNRNCHDNGIDFKI
jgi:hypothetical protein